MEKTVYAKMVNSIVKEITTIIGPVAIVQANNVKGLSVTATGNVDIKGDAVKKIEQLVKAYEVLIGPVAITIAKRAVKTFLEKNKRLQIPEKLR